MRALEALGGLHVGVAGQRAGQGRVTGRGAAAGQGLQRSVPYLQGTAAQPPQLAPLLPGKRTALERLLGGSSMTLGTFQNRSGPRLGVASLGFSNTLLSAC